MRRASTITGVNLSKTGVTYDGIVALWRSPILGKVRDDEPVYENYYNKPVSIIKIEIGHTPALENYKQLLRIKDKKNFPLPLLNPFTIRYLNYTGSSYKEMHGFKDIIITNHGKEIE